MGAEKRASERKGIELGGTFFILYIFIKRPFLLFSSQTLFGAAPIRSMWPNPPLPFFFFCHRSSLHRSAQISGSISPPRRRMRSIGVKSAHFRRGAEKGGGRFFSATQRSRRRRSIPAIDGDSRRLMTRPGSGTEKPAHAGPSGLPGYSVVLVPTPYLSAAVVRSSPSDKG